MQRPALLLIPAVALAALACGQKPEPSPATAVKAEAGQPAQAAPPAAASPPAEAGSLPPGHPPVSGGATAAVNPAEAIGGTVTLGAGIAAPEPKAVLYVIARDPKTQQIVAVRRNEAVSFPFAFTLTGADGMGQAAAFKGPLDLTARLSRSGDAIPAKGDVEGVAKGVTPGSKIVAITLDSVRR
jgi:cytochrome c-type biogenesis protein CcmH